MSTQQPNNPLHGVKLQDIVEKLEAELGWEEMARHVDINCFKKDPSVKSSLKFLRKTPWARDKVEQLYLDTFHSFAWPTSPQKK
ncbi:VF530 family protein [Pseudoalteromonas umbrosa]|uniref:VF530 family protein n=1 Tax=Pseudoalteromonas umbrosa TaxID=3048489 RepID=UPI0024C4124C|nr:VF530 family protein [Pseudoalteromonas sp. B95]MDK1287819.1 VF530 family protein [Pseudoalteromonas sp. B95]